MAKDPDQARKAPDQVREGQAPRPDDPGPDPRNPARDPGGHDGPARGNGWGDMPDSDRPAADHVTGEAASDPAGDAAGATPGTETRPQSDDDPAAATAPDPEPEGGTSRGPDAGPSRDTGANPGPDTGAATGLDTGLDTGPDTGPAATGTLTIAPADRDAVFVLAVDPEAPSMAPLLAPKRLNGSAGATLAEKLGLGDDAADEVELINPADLEGVGLAHYLIEGMGLDPDPVRADRARLDALRAPVALLRGRVAQGEERVLPLPRGLTLLGRYGTGYKPIGLAPLSGRAATASAPVPGPLPTASPLSRPAQVTLIILGIVLLGLILWMALALI